ncbi:hypothetical protein D3C76_717360 [compost metagenome]
MPAKVFIANLLSVNLKAVTDLANIQHCFLIVNFRRYPSEICRRLIGTGGHGSDCIVDGVTIPISVMKPLDIDVEAVTD